MNWNGDDFDCKVEDDEDWPESDIDDEDIKCDEWHTYEIGSPNYADDEGRSIHVMLFIEPFYGRRIATRLRNMNCM